MCEHASSRAYLEILSVLASVAGITPAQFEQALRDKGYFSYGYVGKDGVGRLTVAPSN